MESVQRQDSMSRNAIEDTQVLIPSDCTCKHCGPGAVKLLPVGRAGLSLHRRSAPGLGGCPVSWLFGGGLLLGALLITCVGVCFWQIYGVQTQLRGLQEELARCSCRGDGGDGGGSGREPGDSSAPSTSLTRGHHRASSRERPPQLARADGEYQPDVSEDQIEIEIEGGHYADDDDIIEDVRGGSDVKQDGRRVRREAEANQRRHQNTGTKPRRNREKRKGKKDNKISNKLKKVNKRIDSLNSTLEDELARLQLKLTNLTSRVNSGRAKPNLSAIHLYAHLNTTRDERERALVQNATVNTTNGQLTKYGLRPYAADSSYKFWKAASWFPTNNGQGDLFFTSGTGNAVTVLGPGLYLIYVHIVYHDDFLRAGYNLSLEDHTSQKSVLATCINSIRSKADREHLFRPCDVTTIQYLRAGDRLSIEAGYPHRSTVFFPSFGRHDNDQKNPETNFWGMVKIRGDV